MTPTGRTDVLVQIKPLRAGSALLRFKLLTNGATRDFRVRDVQRRIELLKQTLPGLLERFRIAIGPRDAVRLDASRAGDAFGRLNVVSYGLLDLLLEGSDRNLTAKSFVRELSAFLAPQLALTSRRRAMPPIIELSATDDSPLAWHLPLELFPILYPSQARPQRSPRRQGDDFLSFLGMRAIIVRRRRADDGPEPPRGSSTPLSVIAYCGQDLLPGIKEQLQFFESRAGNFETPQKIWPPDDGVDEDRALQELAEIMSNVQSPKWAARRSRPVLHFCCHYRPSQLTGPELGITDLVAVRVTDLRGQLASPAIPDRSAKNAGRPLVFVNACDSATGTQRDESFLRLLFRRGYCHVIGGETLLPDLVASAFARRVYEHALRGDPIGLAIWQARRYLLERFNNPAGLLYTLYGSPDIRIQ